MIYGKSEWSSFEKGISKEWLLTNGIGGFAGSTLCGANSRRYHGLLLAAMEPPAGRHLVISKFDESVWSEGVGHDIYSHKSGDFIKEGYKYLETFTFDPLPTYNYRVNNILIEKKICMIYGENTTVIRYTVRSGNESAEMRIAPLVNYRDYHQCARRESLRFDSSYEGNKITIRPFDLPLKISIESDTGEFIPQHNNWFFNMVYPVEVQRGLDCNEDHYIPGYYLLKLKPNSAMTASFKVSVEDSPSQKTASQVIAEEELRIKKLKDSCPYDDEFAKRMFAAADAFIVRRGTGDSKTVIAGYPWFCDWGRDTMISLPGLALVTGRYSDAKNIIRAFAEYEKDGLLPNVFPDKGGEPAYNNVDSPLWYFETVWLYLLATNDYDFIKAEIYPVLKRIISAYIKGTHYDIHMDSDHLITAGDQTTQLTWMDAKVGDKVFTPRHGKPVEINALWFNALTIAGVLANKFSDDFPEIRGLAEKARESFNKVFWNEKKECLFDVVGKNKKDDKVRPNQIFACSLTHAVVNGEKAKKIVKKVWDQLYTPFGIRTLSPDSPEFEARYEGDRYRRDESYHQGTAWPWLTGHFIAAYLRNENYSDESRRKAMQMLEPFRKEMDMSCIGHIAEIFDATDPQYPKGCCAQAWSLAEILRAYDMISKSSC